MTFTELQFPSPSPLVRLTDERWSRKGVQLFIKRDDLLAPNLNDPFCGNKWRKLQHNLLHARQQGHSMLLTFGGAYSNHLAALASAGKHLGFKTIGIVRGELVDNPTLALAQQNGMQLHFVDRSTYRKKNEPEYQQELRDHFGPVYLLPEGGTNRQAYLGCAALTREIITQMPQPPTHIAVACGTGGTLTGLLSGLAIPEPAKMIGVSVLKGDFMKKDLQQQLDTLSLDRQNWEMHHQYHHGGYARQTVVLSDFIQDFYRRHEILLEPVYTGKLFYALNDLLEKNHFAPESRVVGIHTGGLQSFACETR